MFASGKWLSPDGALASLPLGLGWKRAWQRGHGARCVWCDCEKGLTLSGGLFTSAPGTEPHVHWEVGMLRSEVGFTQGMSQPKG